MVNFSSIEVRPGGCIEAVTFSKPAGERACFGVLDGSDRLIACGKFSGWLAFVGASTIIVDLALLLFALHLCVHIGEVKSGTRDLYCDRITSLQAKKVDTGSADRKST